MRFLPPLDAAGRSQVLPTADASAIALIDALLCDRPVGSPDSSPIEAAKPQAVPQAAKNSSCACGTSMAELSGLPAFSKTEPLVELLQGDPPLALWVACKAEDAGATPPAGIGDLAAWLAQHAIDSLQWPFAGTMAHDATDAMAESYSRRVAAAVAVAETAASLAAVHGDLARDRAALAGLLHDAAGWFIDATADPVSPPIDRLPRWLVAADPEVAAAVELAVRVVTGQASPPRSAEIDLAAVRWRGEEARLRWLASADPAAGWLPSIATKLARLTALESQFDATVETAKLEAMAEFAAGAGHEINNPLAVIAGRAQLFLRDETDPERRRALALMNAQAMRVHEMIADMRLFARPPQPELERFDLVALVDRLIAEMTPAAAQQQTSLERCGEPGPLEIEADPVQIMVALRALCQNALEALGHHGHVAVTVQRASHGVEIAVADDGPGMTAADRCHIFDPYFSARSANRGLGMGLSKCWRIVTLHGGRIDVDSRPAQGAVFTIRLPKG